MNCQRCGVSLHGCDAWAPCYACGAAQYADFHDVDVLFMQREYNRLLSQQADLIRLAATPPAPKERPVLHWYAPGAAVCNCGQARHSDASPAAPPGWPGNPGTTPCDPSLS